MFIKRIPFTVVHGWFAFLLHSIFKTDLIVTQAAFGRQNSPTIDQMHPPVHTSCSTLDDFSVQS
jgi:hypothetical protein